MIKNHALPFYTAQYFIKLLFVIFKDTDSAIVFKSIVGNL